jgi:hypothetical protein
VAHGTAGTPHAVRLTAGTGTGVVNMTADIVVRLQPLTLDIAMVQAAKAAIEAKTFYVPTAFQTTPGQDLLWLNLELIEDIQKLPGNTTGIQNLGNSITIMTYNPFTQKVALQLEGRTTMSILDAEVTMIWMNSDLEKAKEAILAEQPYNIVGAADMTITQKEAAVQQAVRAKIPAGNNTVANVDFYQGAYRVTLTLGHEGIPAFTIEVTEDPDGTEWDPDMLEILLMWQAVILEEQGILYDLEDVYTFVWEVLWPTIVNFLLDWREVFYNEGWGLLDFDEVIWLLENIFDILEE